MTARKKKKSSGTAKKSRPPLPPRPRPKTAPPPPAAPRAATGFSSLIRGVAEAAVGRPGAGGDVPAGLPGVPRGLASSMPEISVRQGPAGRSTLDAIAREAKAPAVRVTTRTAETGTATAGPKVHEGSLPDISVAYLPGGRDTLAAIQREISGDDPADSAPASTVEARRPEPGTGIRERRTTLGFEERPLRDASGRTMKDSAPEVITLEETPIGRATLAAIAAEAAEREADDADVTIQTGELDDETLAAIQEETSAEAPPLAAGELRIHEVVTFVVRGLDPRRLASQDARKAFVAQHVMHRLPVWSLDDVDRVDLARSDDGSFVVLQILCRLTGADR